MVLGMVLGPSFKELHTALWSSWWPATLVIWCSTFFFSSKVTHTNFELNFHLIIIFILCPELSTPSSKINVENHFFLAEIMTWCAKRHKTNSKRNINAKILCIYLFIFKGDCVSFFVHIWSSSVYPFLTCAKQITLLCKCRNFNIETLILKHTLWQYVNISLNVLQEIQTLYIQRSKKNV